VPNTSLLTSDIEEFRHLLRTGGLSAAARMIKGPFLPQPSAKAPPTFADWRDHKVRALKRDLRAAAAAAWDRATQADDWTSCREAAEALFGLDPHSATAASKAIESRALDGSPQGAEAAYQLFKETLHTGKRPPAEMVELVARVRKLNVSIRTTRTRDVTPFFGRVEELRKLRKGWESLSPSRAQFAFVSGESGIGKTRLSREFSARVHLEGAAVANWKCQPTDSSLALGPVADALLTRELRSAVDSLSEPWRSVLSSLRGGHPTTPSGQPHQELHAEDANRRLLESVHKLLHALAGGRPLLVVLDDAQWADQTTLEALNLTRTRWKGRPLLVLLVHEPLNFFRDKSSLPQRTFTGVDWGLELSGLNVDAAKELVMSVAGPQPKDEDVARVVSATGGNPLLLSELAQGHSEGPLKPLGEDQPLPISCERVFRARLERLSPAALTLLEVLAIAQAPLSTVALKEISGIASPQVIAATDELFAARLVDANRASASVRHDVIRWVTMASIGPARRASLHVQIADVLLRQDGATNHQIATHYALGGRRQLAFEHACKSADAAEAQGALHEAVASLALAKENAEAPLDRLRAAAREGGLLWLRREDTRAMGILSAAVRGLRAEGAEAEALRAEVQLFDLLHSSTANPSGLLPGIRRVRLAAASLGLHGVVCDALDVELHLASDAGDLPAARAALADAQQYLTRSLDAGARCSALCILAGSNYYSAQHAGLSAAQEAVALAEQTGEVRLALTAVNRLAMSMIHSGEFGILDGMGLTATALNTASRVGHLLSHFHLRLNRGVWLLECGDHDEALIEFADAAEVIKGAGLPKDHALVLVNQGEALLDRADYEEATRVFEETLHVLREHPTSKLVGIGLAGLGLASLGRGARRQAREAAVRLPSDPQFWSHDPTLIAMFRGRMLEKSGRAAEADEYLSSIMDNIWGRFQTVWVKLGLERARIIRPIAQAHSAAIALEVLPEAERLGLGARVLQARTLAPRKA
jgi:tetratricopeptide (TPR) repeat protein